MKKIIIVLFLITSISSYSQTNLLELSSYKTDCYGRNIKNASLQQTSFHNQMIVQSTMQYDTIRALTEINDTLNADAYPWISADGLRMYFIRGAGGAGGNNQLMFTDRVNTNTYFSSPVVVPLGLSNPTSCWFSNDELNVYICKDSSLYFANRSTSSSPFNTPVAINLTGSYPFSFVAGASLNAAQDRLFISLLYISFSSLTITEFSRTSSTSFSYVRTLIGSEAVGQLSKDELNYFFSAEFSLGSSQLYQVSRNTPVDSFDLSTLQLIQGINDSITSNFQPSMTDSLNWVAFVKNNTGFWQGNDLYIAHKDILASILNQETKPFSVSLFPNPSSGPFTISLPTDNGEITIKDILGQEIIKTSATQKKMNLLLDKNGVYFIYFKTKDGIITQKLIVNR